MKKTSLFAALVLAASGLGLPADAASGADQPFVEVVDVVHPTFSPNGDGRLDKAPFTFGLAGAATVTATVLRLTPKDDGSYGWDHHVVRREQLGVLPRGTHRWAWDGRRSNDTLVRDGRYDVVFATRHARHTHRTSRVAVVVDTNGSGELITSRPTVYPLATAVQDSIDVVFVVDDWSLDSNRNYLPSRRQTRLRILSAASGEKVWQATRPNNYTPAFSWDGRDQDGAVVAPGSYVAKLRTIDDVGIETTEEVELTVSDQQLVEKTWTGTVTAARTDADQEQHECGSCETAGIPPVPSERFRDGLRFQALPPLDGFSRHAQQWSAMSPPFEVAPVDSYRVSAVGGPSTLGSANMGHLSTFSGSDVTTPAGDGTTTTPWVSIQTQSPTLHWIRQPAVWNFSTNEQMSYDVASFTVDYRYYAPGG